MQFIHCRSGCPLEHDRNDVSEQRGRVVVCPDAHDSDRRVDRLGGIQGIGALEIILHQGPTDGYSLLNRCLVPGRSEKRRIRLWSGIPQPGTRLTKRWEDKKQVCTSPVPIEIFHRQPVEYNVQVGPSTHQPGRTRTQFRLVYFQCQPHTRIAIVHKKSTAANLVPFSYSSPSTVVSYTC